MNSIENLYIDFVGNNTKCSAEVELEGISESWTANAKITGHPTVKDVFITYRLGDYLTPYFGSESDLQFFTPLLYKIDGKAKVLLPKKFAEEVETI